MPVSLDPADFRAPGGGGEGQQALPGGKSRIEVDKRGPEELRKQAWAALRAASDPLRLFRRNGGLLRVVEEGDGSVRVEELTPDRLRHELTNAADWYRGGRQGRPPMDLVQDLLADPIPPLPKLTRLVRVPVFLADGRLLKEGYDGASGVLCLPPAELRDLAVPEHPTRDDVRAAVKLILDIILGEFPFVSEADRAHALALFLLPFIRELILGPTPLHLIWKPAPGTGGTLLAEVLLYPALGRWPTALAAPKDEGEWRRTLFAALHAHPEYIFLDNVCVLQSPTLALAITDASLQDRVVGSSAVATVPARCAWVATGNDPLLSDELRRRMVPIRLDAGPCPELRRDFKITNLKQVVTLLRPELVAAALIIIQSWVSAGRPRSAARLASFEDWAQVMGGILTSAGVPGFLSNLHDLPVGRGPHPLMQFLGRWHEKYGDAPVGVAELLELADELVNSSLPKHKRAISLGRQLAARAGEQFGPYRIERVGTYQAAAQYRLIRQEPEADEAPEAPANE